VGARHGDEEGHREQRRREGGEARAPVASAPERDAAEHDVERQERNLGREPSVGERVLADHRREHERRGEQHRVHDVGQVAQHDIALPRRVRKHQPAAQHEQHDREDCAGDVCVAQRQVELRHPGRPSLRGAR
jgi:hypothetical protein